MNNIVVIMIFDIDIILVDVFNGILLYNLMKIVVGCVIENKFYIIEKVMTWIYDKV